MEESRRRRGYAKAQTQDISLYALSSDVKVHFWATWGGAGPGGCIVVTSKARRSVAKFRYCILAAEPVTTWRARGVGEG